MHNNRVENFTDQPTHSVATAMPQSRDISRSTNTTNHKKYGLCVTLLSVISIIVGIVLLIICAIEFQNLTMYLKAQCFVLSAGLGAFDESGVSGTLYRAVWQVILYDRNGNNATTAVWSSESERPPGPFIQGVLAQYQVNHTYPCYHVKSSVYPGDIHFEQRPATKALVCLVVGLALIIFGIILFLYKAYFHMRHRHDRIKREVSAQRRLRDAINTIKTPSEQHYARFSTPTSENIADEPHQEIATIEEQWRKDNIPPSIHSLPNYSQAEKENVY